MYIRPSEDVFSILYPLKTPENQRCTLPPDMRRKLNVHKMFRRRLSILYPLKTPKVFWCFQGVQNGKTSPEHFMHVQFTTYVRGVNYYFPWVILQR